MKGRKETAMVRRALLVWVVLCVVRAERCGDGGVSDVLHELGCWVGEGGGAGGLW